MNKVTRICIFAILLALLFVIIGEIFMLALDMRFYINDLKYETIGKEYYLKRVVQHSFKMFGNGIVFVAIVVLLIINRHWFFMVSVDDKRAKKIEKMQEKLNNLKGDE